MNAVTRRRLGVSVDYDHLLKRLRLDDELADEFKGVYDECVRIADPKYIYCEHPVLREGSVTIIGDCRFESKLMEVNLSHSASCFAHVCTCGRELYDFSCSQDDALYKYWIDTVSEEYMFAASRLLHQELVSLAGSESLSTMSPGSLEDFPIQRQKEVFSLLGDVTAETGVWLTEGFLMMPYKSGSGITYASDEKFVSCQLCRRENCPNRRAPFDEMMLVNKFGL